MWGRQPEGPKADHPLALEDPKADHPLAFTARKAGPFMVSTDLRQAWIR